jgi:two-component system, chemotaxis family, sensor kinase CheA
VNEFEQQFLVESRELAEQATEGLLALEQSPHDAEGLDAVFRAFHTLKGGSAIVEFAAMERVMHAAEDVLSAARSGQQPLNTDLVGRCLACIDLALQWLDTLEQTGQFSPEADGQANNLIQRFGNAGEGGLSLGPNAPTSGGVRDWITVLLERNPDLRVRAKSAVRYVPAPNCFYEAEDPLERMSSLPDLLAFDLEARDEWPPLDDFDPFHCNLILTALSAASVQNVSSHMRGHSGACEVLSIDAEGIGAAAPNAGMPPTVTASTGPAPATTGAMFASLPPAARAVLEAQLALLGEAKPPAFAGRVGSAGRTAANVLRFCGREADAKLLVRATDDSLANNTIEPLREALARALSPRPAVVPAPAPNPIKRPDATPRTLRVDAERIDALVRLTGELTIAKNSIGHVAKLAQDDGSSLAGVLKERHAVLEHLINELQRAVLAIRVLPLRSVLQRLPRVVREMAATLGKPVRLEIEGEATEADKTIVEMLFEPLLHIVRNAIDHGVESPAIRAQRGKPAEATVRVRASRQADQVLVEVSDDGGGIDLDRVRLVAAQRGVVTDETLRTMTETDLIDLVFAPGFSTAAKITELSGRGVGLDTVRTAVERIGGRVAIESRAGLGTTVRFSLPFSMMMTHVITVEAGGQVFGLPLDAVVETVRLPREAIAGVGAAHAVVLRDRTIPLVELAEAVGDRQRLEEADGDATIVIAAVAGQMIGLHVDRLGERMEVILKPLDGLLADTPGISGTTLLGDGRVLLLLDLGEMLQ